MAKKSTKTRLSKDEVDWLKKHDTDDLILAYDRLTVDEVPLDRKYSKHKNRGTKQWFASKDALIFADRGDLDIHNDQAFTYIKKLPTDKYSISKKGYSVAELYTNNMHMDNIYFAYINVVARKSDKNFKNFEFEDGESECRYIIHFPLYALNENDAIDRMLTYIELLGYDSQAYIVTGAELSKKTARSWWLSLLKEILRLRNALCGLLKKQSKSEELLYKFRYVIAPLIPNHVMALPTRKMLDEMIKSIEWVNNLINKIRDADIKENRRIFFSTEEGKKWKKIYDDDLEYAKHLKSIMPYVTDEYTIDGKSPKKSTKLKKSDSELKSKLEPIILTLKLYMNRYNELYRILKIVKNGEDDNSSNVNKYTSKIAPVTSTHFTGTGYAYDAYDSLKMIKKFKDNGHVKMLKNDAIDVETKVIRVAIKNNDGKYKSISVLLQYCKLDDTKTDLQCADEFKQFAHDMTESTFNWCKENGNKSNMSIPEIWSWCVNVLKKHYPQINPAPFLNEFVSEKSNIEGIRKAAIKTILWVINKSSEYKWPKIRTEHTILSVLRKHGIEPSSVEDDIEDAIFKRYKSSLFLNTINKIHKNK